MTHAGRFAPAARGLMIALLASAAMAGAAQAYVLIRETATSPPQHWLSAAQPVLMQLNDQIGPALPNVAAGSDPRGAVTRALGKWPAASAFRFAEGSTAITSAGSDGINLISFANTQANRQAFEMAGGNAVVGLTLSFFRVGGEITEADVIFNPALQFSTTLDTDTALRAAGQFDVAAVATHELGHVIGLHHSGVESAAMWSLTSVLQRQLDSDDIAGARVLYPNDGASARIAGRVTVNGGAAFGAQVVAVDQRGVVAASALSLPDGTYAIEQLAPSTYDVYVEPLDGPHSSVPNVACIRVGNLSGAGIYSGATLTTDFPTRFADNLAVSAGATAALDFVLPSGAPPVNPAEIGTATEESDGSLIASVASHPIAVMPGDSLILVVAGTKLDQVVVGDVDLGPDISLDAEGFQIVMFSCNDAPLPAFLVGITVAPNAAGGGHSIVLRTGSERVVLTAALRVQTPELPTPTPSVTPTPTVTPTRTATATPTATRTIGPSSTPGACVGDCDASGDVTVDELVRGVNIALGIAPLTDCPLFDTDHSDDVTVDELVRAVNAALNRC